MTAEAERTTELDRIIFFSDGVLRRIVDIRSGDAGAADGAFA